MAYTKSDMYYQDYSWSTKYTNDDPRVTGEPDRTLLARTEGWEMLYFVNKLAQKWNWTEPITRSQYQKIEKAIRDYVPGDVRSQENIKTWIETNHKSFWDKI